MKRIVLMITLVGFSLLGTAATHQADVADNIGIVEKRGQRVPLDLTFSDENGKPVKLSNIVTKPTILTLVYYSCNNICPQMLGGLATTIGSIKLTPGKDYAIVTISFDEDDTPAIARDKKVNYIKATGLAFPEVAWHFLTGNRESIGRLTEAVGFSFRKTEVTRSVGFGSRKVSSGFIHPSVLIFLAPDGKITKYLYVDQPHYGTLAPIAFSPVEITMALMDASRGKVWIGSRNPILLCFPNLSEQEARFYTILATVGAATLFCIVAFFIYLRKTSRAATSKLNEK